MTAPMYGVTRATATVIGAAAAGFLLWLATQVGDTSTGGYWARYGIVAGAGLVLALSQLLGGWTKWGMPRLARPVFVFAFIPALIVVGWILLFHEPETTWFSRHVVSWSGDLGIDGFVNDLGAMLPAIALGARARLRAQLRHCRPAPPRAGAGGDVRRACRGGAAARPGRRAGGSAGARVRGDDRE